MKNVFLVAMALLSVSPLVSQKGYQDSKTSHYRLICVDTVTKDKAGHRFPAHMAGKLAAVVFAYHPNGKYVLVEYTAANYKDLDDVRQATAAAQVGPQADSNLQTWDRHLQKRENIEPFLKSAGFDTTLLDKVFVRVK